MELTIDNRPQAEMTSYHEARIDALRRALQDVQRERERLLALVDELSQQNASLREQLSIVDEAFVRVLERC